MIKFNEEVGEALESAILDSWFSCRSSYPDFNATEPQIYTGKVIVLTTITPRITQASGRLSTK